MFKKLSKFKTNRISRDSLSKIKGGMQSLGGVSAEGCNAYADCGECNQVSCSGNTSCSGEDNVGVTCDDTTTKCAAQF